jgi:hypothetical protein
VQVGKGRDMGFLSILGFFSKLSMGTVQMSTTRQAYRLGVRLGLARLMGFYCALQALIILLHRACVRLRAVLAVS